MDKIIVEAKVEKLDAVLDFVNKKLEDNDCPMKTQIQIDVAVEEIFVNIASYAYAPGEGDATIEAEIYDDPLRIAIRFTDSGMPYDPLAKEDPDVTLPAEERQIGGLGIYMVKKSMDEVAYEHKDGNNVFTIIKNL
ncbi:MAG: ATP-binding protein [Lachnospiraceae bacterium]|nr:ATP-binding protein [Lachnospiraceae bacterium]